MHIKSFIFPDIYLYVKDLCVLGVIIVCCFNVDFFDD